MEEVQDYPKEGQFVAVWENDGDIWAEEYKWRDGKFYHYDDRKERFSDECCPSEYPWAYNIDCVKKFFVIE